MAGKKIVGGPDANGHRTTCHGSRGGAIVIHQPCFSEPSPEMGAKVARSPSAIALRLLESAPGFRDPGRGHLAESLHQNSNYNTLTT